jgi:hypothetical protein
MNMLIEALLFYKYHLEVSIGKARARKDDKNVMVMEKKLFKVNGLIEHLKF